jgi:hypothetical protein
VLDTVAPLRLYAMGHGRIVFEGTPAQLRVARKEWLEA